MKSIDDAIERLAHTIEPLHSWGNEGSQRSPQGCWKEVETYRWVPDPIGVATLLRDIIKMADV